MLQFYKHDLSRQKGGVATEKVLTVTAIEVVAIEVLNLYYTPCEDKCRHCCKHT